MSLANLAQQPSGSTWESYIVITANRLPVSPCTESLLSLPSFSFPPPGVLAEVPLALRSRMTAQS